MNKTVSVVGGAVLALLIITGITTCAGFNAPQSVGYVPQEQEAYSTQYRECQEVEGQYVKATLNLQVDKLLAGCVN